MAARRLIAILLVLLFLSSLAAALAPVPEREGSTSSSTSTTEASTLPGAGAAQEPRLVKQTLDASVRRPVAIRARIGDRLELKVTSQLRSGTIELAGLGPTEDVGPAQPAFFDVLLREDGEYSVGFLGTDDEIARIVVSPPRMAPVSR